MQNNKIQIFFSALKTRCNSIEKFTFKKSAYIQFILFCFYIPPSFVSSFSWYVTTYSVQITLDCFWLNPTNS